MKINPNQLESARGLRIAIVPSRELRSDKVRLDVAKNLVICPLPFDGSFMEVFYIAWGVVQHFIAADAHVPKAADLPVAQQRAVARYLEERRDFTVLEVVEALKPLSQPELLVSREETKSSEPTRSEPPLVDTVIAPIALTIEPEA